MKLIYRGMLFRSTEPLLSDRGNTVKIAEKADLKFKSAPK
jgi:hypothetical protein